MQTCVRHWAGQCAPASSRARYQRIRPGDRSRWATSLDFPVVVTTYEVAMREASSLSRLEWQYIVVDEGHRLKNMNCRLIKLLKTYPCHNRLLLTGTPLQNSLSELWSLLNFLQPDVFDDFDLFEQWCGIGGGSGGPGSTVVQAGRRPTPPTQRPAVRAARRRTPLTALLTRQFLFAPPFPPPYIQVQF